MADIQEIYGQQQLCSRNILRPSESLSLCKHLYSRRTV